MDERRERMDKTRDIFKSRYGLSAYLVRSVYRCKCEGLHEFTEKINSRNYFTPQMQGEIENIFKGTVGEGMFEFAGQKGGSTAFVLTNSFYGTDKKGNKIEIVFMMNNLSEKAFEKLLSNMDYFIRDIVISEEFRNKL